MAASYYNGRVNRRGFVWSLFSSAFAGAALVLMWGLFISDTMKIQEGAGGALFIIVGLFHSIAVVKRFHDINMRGWFYWLLYVPVINLVMIFLLFFKRGTEGPNRFGRDPLE